MGLSARIFRQPRAAPFDVALFTATEWQRSLAVGASPRNTGQNPDGSRGAAAESATLGSVAAGAAAQDARNCTAGSRPRLNSAHRSAVERRKAQHQKLCPGLRLTHLRCWKPIDIRGTGETRQYRRLTQLARRLNEFTRVRAISAVSDSPSRRAGWGLTSSFWTVSPSSPSRSPIRASRMGSKKTQHQKAQPWGLACGQKSYRSNEARLPARCDGVEPIIIHAIVVVTLVASAIVVALLVHLLAIVSPKDEHLIETFDRIDLAAITNLSVYSLCSCGNSARHSGIP